MLGYKQMIEATHANRDWLVWIEPDGIHVKSVESGYTVVHPMTESVESIAFVTEGRKV